MRVITARSWSKRGVHLILLSALFSACLVGGVAVGAAYMYAPSVLNPTAHAGCVIRFDEKTRRGATRPTIYANSAHYCVGVKRVYAAYPSGDLVIVQQSAGPVISINVSPDETLTARGIDCGASGGINVTRCYDEHGRVKAYSSKMYGALANLWVGWVQWDK